MTQPGRGCPLTLSRRASRTGRRRSSNNAALTPVVPSSIPRVGQVAAEYNRVECAKVGRPNLTAMGMMTLEELLSAADEGTIDTVLLCIADMGAAFRASDSPRGISSKFRGFERL